MEIFFLYTAIIFGFSGVLLSIFKPGNNGMRVATWTMWLVMDIMALVGTIAKGEDPTLLWLFVIGTILVVLALLYKKQYGWTWVESLTAFLMIICVVIMFTTDDPKTIIWSNSLALFIGGIPILRDFTEIVNPDPALIYSGVFFLIGMILALIMATEAGDEYILPGQAFVFWVLALGILLTRPKNEVVGA